MGKVINVFCILRGLNENVRVPVQSFIEENAEKARLYFEAYILGEEKPEQFTLYKIAEVNKGLTDIKVTKIFITGGYEQTFRRRLISEDITQKRLEYKKLIEEKNKDTAEIVQRLFNGKIIK